MSRITAGAAPNWRMRGGVDAGASDDDMGVEDSLRGPHRSLEPRLGRAQAATTHSGPGLPNTPSSAGLLDAYAFAATPDAALPNDARSILAEPPRLQRPVQQAPSRGAAAVSQGAFPPGPARASSGLFAAPAARPVPHGNLFARPPQTFGASLGHFDLDTSASASISVSGSFSFGPAAARGRPEGMPSIRPGPMLFHAGRAAAVQTRQTSDAALFAAPQTPVRPARATTAIAAATAMAQPPSPASLETAALAAERRTRQQRSARPDASVAASMAASAGDVPNRRVVSFSTTPAEAAMTPANMLAAPSRAGVPGAVPARAGAARAMVAESSFSHLGRGPSRPMLLPGAAAGQRDVSMSLSDVSASVHGAATRLFPCAAPLPSASSGVFGSESMPDPQQSWSQHPSTSLSGRAIEPVEQVRLRRWDGAHTSVPAYLVADNADTAVEEQFDFDTVARFDVRQLVARHEADVAGEGKQQTQEEGDTDALQAILDIQLGLRGLHGWYGHTYRNPRRDAAVSGAGESGRTSRKRRRRDSGASDASNASDRSRQSGSDVESDEDAPIVVYDTFGRVRGTVTLPNYTHRGGRPFPLPAPRETHAVRSASAAHTVRTRCAALGEKEAALVQQCELVCERYAQLQPDANQTVRSTAFYKQLAARRTALAAFRKRMRPTLIKGLQNAYLDSAQGVAHRR